MKNMVTIAVIGGGFGGIFAIKQLQTHFKEARIILFEPRGSFVFTPLIHEVATDVLHESSVTHEYSRIFRKNVEHIQKKAVKIDTKKQIVFTDTDSYDYDYLIVAIGSRTRKLKQGLPVLELKDIEDALKIRKYLELSVKRGGSQKLKCVIVGGGPTGVELAAEVMDFLDYKMMKLKPEVTILQSGPSLFKGVNPKIQTIALNRLKKKGINVVFQTRVQDVEKGLINANVDEVPKIFKADIIVWTAGVSPNLIASNVAKFKDRFVVKNTLQLENFPNVFSVGDVSYIKENPLPDLAQVAVQEGVHAAKNIIRIHKKKNPLPFRYNNKGFLISLGQGYGAGVIKGFVFKGRFAWFVWRTVYLVKFVGVKSKFRMACEYTLRLFKKYG